ncbi:alpha-D-ribose 1-methylphosphonate 5-triphosphate diphosphatase [uncultured Tateyamaria sp.]|uniref:alpha-D-ribose 1-methylphosphonate 5-triphosphate diphosphatase n=1 Tax=uncultured Tateyamaria sp. TaxID=455651 RepID=UPI0026380741|nr:alpha-D-ribose 1-methylphosphonate 5-triphosphate diphosphatase [uncultured Tateyamaria sp.]
MDTLLERPAQSVTGLTLTGGRMLRPDGTFADADVHMETGVITDTAPAAPRVVDVSNCLILPGIIDAHGDGHEHHLMPRAGADFPEWVGLRNVDRELIANGITTAYLAQSYSWEGEKRGADAARAVIDALQRLHPAPTADIRIQLRYETFYLDGAEQLLAWLEDGTVQYVVFNNHIPQFEQLRSQPEHVARWAATIGLKPDEFWSLMAETVEDGVGVLDAIARLSDAMRRLGVPFGSHDDPDPETRRSYNAVGANIAEFPLTRTAAQTARDLGNAIMMGAPNALRGISTSGNVSARELIASGLCDALVSDYYYPSLLHAPFKLAQDGVCDLGKAWQLVSSGPAKAVDLHDRGALSPGLRGDLIVVRQDDLGRPHLLASFVGGQLAFTDSSFAMHL